MEEHRRWQRRPRRAARVAAASGSSKTSSTRVAASGSAAGGGAGPRRGAQHDLWRAWKKAESLPPLSGTLLPSEKGDVRELDELWSFVGSSANTRRVWMALCRQTRQIIARFVGSSSADSARALCERIPAGSRCPRQAQRLLAGL